MRIAMLDCMQWNAVSVFALACLVAAAGSCADARMRAEPDAEAGDSGARDDDRARGDDGARSDDPAPGKAGIPDTNPATPDSELCPRDPPKPGGACRARGQLLCTYPGDGPCSPTNPDRIAVCAGGKWGALGPGIACPGVGAADGGAVDCSAPLTLDVYCQRQGMGCSTPFVARRDSYCDPMYRHFTATVQANDCGGQTLLTRLGNGKMRFDYDAADNLRSVQSSDDVPYGVCMRHEYVYGEPCELVGTARPACGSSEDDAGTSQ